MKFAQDSTSSEKGSRRLVTVLVVLVLIFIVVFGYLYTAANPLSGKGEAVAVTIPVGATGAEIASLLKEKGVVGNVALFKAYEKFDSPGSPQAGKYTFYKHDSFGNTISILKKGPTIKTYQVTFPEGFRVNQMAQRISNKIPGHKVDEFMKVAQSGKFESEFVKLGTKDLQGYLFPDTYHIDQDATDEQIVQMMLNRFDEIAKQEDLAAKAEALGYTPAEVVTVASLIEKEVKRDEDRAPAAGVMYNRLKTGMKLELDSTATYAAEEFDRATQLRDREVDSPYNTFKVTGLPPGPIDSPGQAAIRAALHPTGDYIFFITVNDCTNETVFTKTLSDFNVAVARRTRENPEKCA